MGIYTERKIGIAACAAIVAAAFALLYGIWLFVGPELMRSEVLYASAAAEFAPGKPLSVTIHGWTTPECMPLMPMAAKLLRTLTGAPMESILRGLSILMLGAGAVLVYFAAVSRTSFTAGIVAAAMYCCCFLSLGTAIEGTPATGNAFFLAAAQLIFFRYGIRHSDWDRAWISSALLVALGFLTGGVLVPVFFVFPMFFFRRPLSVASKFRRPGFAAAVVIVALAVLLWSVSFSSSPRQISVYEMWWRQLSDVSLGWRMLTFPFAVMFWLLPWGLIAWIPFCVALQAIDRTPIYSRYLRTLAISSLVLLWLLPEIGRFGLFYALMPLSVLTGRFYELGMRRYGIRLRRFFLILEIFMVAVPLLIVAGWILPETWLQGLFSVEQSVGFRGWSGFRVAAWAALAVSVLLAFYVHRMRERDPVWAILLAAVTASALFFNVFQFPYRSQERSKRDFGSRLSEVMSGKARRLYTKNVRNLNGGLFYAGIEVFRLDETFPPDAEPEVYLLSGEFPQIAGYGGWSKVWEQTYNGHPLTVWKGRRSRPEGAAPSAASPENGGTEQTTEVKPGENK